MAEDRSGDDPKADDDADKHRDDDEDKDGKSSSSKQDGDDADDDDDEDADEDDGKPPLYKRPVFWIVIGIVAAILIVGGILYWLNARKYQSTDDAFIDAHVVRIAAETTGRLTQVAPVDNRHVKAGQLLAVIEPGGPQATRAEAEAGIAEADAGIEQAQARVIQARAAYAQALASAETPRAEEQRAAADYARYRELQRLDPLAAAPTQLGQARAQAQSARAQSVAARRQADSAAADILAAERQVSAARAQRRAAEARLSQANVTVSYLRIRAPVDGQVVQRSVNVGSYVAPGQQLMAIVPDDLWVTANFKETQLTLMRAGQNVLIRIDAYPDLKFSGYVESIQRGAGQAFQLLPPQNATGNYVKVVQRVPVRIRFRGDDWRKLAIGPGMSVVPRVTVRD